VADPITNRALRFHDMVTVFDVMVVMSAVHAMHALRILVLVLILSFPFLAKLIDKQITVHCIV
jgi:hypothetical protein